MSCGCGCKGGGGCAPRPIAVGAVRRVGEVPPPATTDWGLVAATGVALTAVVVGFWGMLQGAGRATR